MKLPGYQGVPNGYPMAPPAYNAMNYGPNGVGGKYPSKKVGIILYDTKISILYLSVGLFCICLLLFFLSN